MKRFLIGLSVIAALLAVGAAYLFYPVLFPPERITVATWGGTYAHAQRDAFFHPYTDKTGTVVDTALYGGGLREITAQVRSGKPEWDVVDLELEDALRACEQGLLETIDPKILPPDRSGADAARDFEKGALGRCFVGSIIYSQIVAYAPALTTEGRQAPTRLMDFFDLARFPGGRGMQDTPRYNLEMALLADGVLPEEVYGTLATEQGVTRAFAALDKIKTGIVWYSDPAEATDLLKTRATMTTALNARVYEAGEEVARPVWDRQIYALDVFGVLKGADKERALDFIAFATQAENLARMSEWLPYGPARQSALPLVGRNRRTGAPMVNALPNSIQNWSYALAFDPSFWTRNEMRLGAQWRRWRNGTN